MADVAARRAAIESAGTQVAFVHMESADDAAAYLAREGMPGALHVSDPEARLYGAFGLQRGSLRQVFLSPRVWWGGIRSIFLEGHRATWPRRGPLQMPGVFLVRRGSVERAFRHRTTAERPDYLALAAVAGDDHRTALAPEQDNARRGGQQPEASGRPDA